MRTEVLSDIALVQPEQWNQLAAGNLYAGFGWARYQQRDTNSDARYALVRDDSGALIAATALYLVRKETNPLYDPSHLFGKDCPPASTVTALVGNRRGYRNILLLNRSDPEQARQALRLLVDMVDRIAADEADGYAWWLYLDEDDAALLRPHLNHSEPWLIAGDAEIQLPGTTFEDYLDRVGPKIRKRVRRDRLLFARAGYRRDTRPLTEVWQEAGSLVANLERHHGHEAGSDETADLLRGQAEELGADAHAHMCLLDAATIGVGIAYTTRTEVASRACGFDYSQLRGAAEYFELAYYAPIEQAYDTGATALLLGLGTYETKIRRGADIRLRWGLVGGIHASGHTGSDVKRHNRARWRELVDNEGVRPDVVRDSFHG